MSKIVKTPAGLKVPYAVTIPFIEGDGIGKEISPVCRKIDAVQSYGDGVSPF